MNRKYHACKSLNLRLHKQAILNPNYPLCAPSDAEFYPKSFAPFCLTTFCLEALASRGTNLTVWLKKEKKKSSLFSLFAPDSPPNMQASPEFFIPDSFPLGDALLCPAFSVSREESQWFALKNNVIPVQKNTKKKKICHLFSRVLDCKGGTSKIFAYCSCQAEQVSIWELKDCFDWFWINILKWCRGLNQIWLVLSENALEEKNTAAQCWDFEELASNLEFSAGPLVCLKNNHTV